MTFSDHLRPTESLAEELFDLKEHAAQPYLTEEREDQLRLRMAVISFELKCRAEESADARTFDS